jgi:ABC-type uncharacterized transport system permease subunit
MVMMAFALLTFFIGPLSGTLSNRFGCRGLGIAGMLIRAAGLVLLSRLGATTDNLDVFINGLHWSYLTGALFSVLSATAVLLAKSDMQTTQV